MPTTSISDQTVHITCTFDHKWTAAQKKLPVTSLFDRNNSGAITNLKCFKSIDLGSGHFFSTFTDFDKKNIKIIVLLVY
jgi:hypothetical protein